MPTINQLIGLRDALLKDHDNREAVINLLYDAFTGVFSNSIERLKKAHAAMGDVMQEIDNAIARIRTIGANENLCASAMAILSEEKKYLIMVNNDFFSRIKKIEIESIDINQVKKSEDNAIALNALKKRENDLIRQIEDLIASISKQRNEELFP